ncbi:MAG TPA: ribosome maturation factor RimM [Nitrospira sp.]|nr:ribosome maturation factor RimM [Nitrospira sp.]
MASSIEMVTIGKIERPFGVHGAVKVRSLSDRPGRFEQLRAVHLADSGGLTVDRMVRHVRRAGPSYIVEFEDVTTPEQAGVLRGALLQVPRTVPSVSEGDAWYECDLIGMTVADEDGHELGSLETIWDLPAHKVFVVRRDGREVLIPAIKAFVRSIDVVQQRITVRLIEGLVEA